MLTREETRGRWCWEKHEDDQKKGWPIEQAGVLIVVSDGGRNWDRDDLVAIREGGEWLVAARRRGETMPRSSRSGSREGENRAGRIFVFFPFLCFFLSVLFSFFDLFVLTFFLRSEN